MRANRVQERWQMINEEQVELLAIDWFKELGFEYLLGYDIAPQIDAPARLSYQEVLLEQRLNKALTKLNPTTSNLCHR